MTGAVDRAECGVRWCEEAGEHWTHRLYLASIPVVAGRWSLGVTIARPGAEATAVELTAMARRGTPVMVHLTTREAQQLAAAMNDAVKRVHRLIGRGI
ncbi:hypothetical protein [Jiangella asiatica]|uniref:Uncharacterized protein n=1 Tax=Jiangella asiatica TaxID=2530372 RepID=A0A4R5DFE5_9ACTN|nr:hypothetical protein [Jiangella asiatica]TDE12636.1 hypothetical protein E1269_07320 [Jiangella asiatica]